MGGLSVSYINNKLTAESTTTKTRNLILDFLNTAANASAIAGIEHKEGPVFDDPEEGYGDQVRDYDIGKTVAQKIINKRNSLGGFTNLNQLANISHFAKDKFNDLLYSFSKRVTEISAVRFNFHSAAITNDALNIRRNYSTTAPLPEWKKGTSSTYSDSPVAYAIKETHGNTLCIRASFKVNNISVAYIRAVGGGRMGTVKERAVSFNSSGYSGYETFELQNTTFHSHGVNAYNIRWRWQWRLKPTDTWKDLEYTHHRIYIILQAPTLPWKQTWGSTSLPWADGLEVSCSWAKGATNQDTAATLIAKKYNECGVVAYDTTSGATFYGWGSYNLTEMIERLNGGIGLGGLVNCTDSANTVSTFSNLIGCDLWQCRMSSFFQLNPMIAIGHNTWAIPFSGSFSYHEVAWKGACTEHTNVFDGCLKVDGDADPTSAPHTPLLPVNMLFGNCTTMNYRLRLCPPTPNGCTRCIPRPTTTRQRRPII